jgi:hypothetical protein
MGGRHGYVDDLDSQSLAMWRGRVASAIRGKRGQKMLAEIRDALDAMPVKRLVSRQLQTKQGDVCTLGCLAAAKGQDLTEYEDAEECDLQELNESLAATFDVAQCLIQEVEYENDEGAWKETPEQRWTRMRRWVGKKLGESTS